MKLTPTHYFIKTSEILALLMNLGVYPTYTYSSELRLFLERMGKCDKNDNL